MSGRLRAGVRAVGLALIVAVVVGAEAHAATQARRAHDTSPASHVLLLSVDGLHQSDLAWWVHTHPHSVLATLARNGTLYPNAHTPVPSDSFPGLLAQLTGGDPRTTGVYYDDSYNRRLLAPGSPCTPGQTTGLGTEVAYAENLAANPDSIDSGFGIPNLYPGLPSSALALPGDLHTIDTRLIDPALLPIDPRTCDLVYPRQYLRVNTVFAVAHRAGLRTAWADKHAAYELVNGPGGRTVDDLFTPEINSSTTDPSAPAGVGPDWTADNRATQFYDAIKVQAILNEIAGRDHSGVHHVGTPALFGMNFQSVSTAEKLPLSPIDGADEPGGYRLAHGRWVPGPVLKDALGFVDRQVGRMVERLRRHHLLGATTIILSAKHGQAPIETTALKRIDDGNVIDALNAAWTAHGGAGDLVAFSINDDAMEIWLRDRSDGALAFATRFLLHYGQPASAHAATDYSGNPIAFHRSGLTAVARGTAYFHVLKSDPRAPDLVGIVQHGVVYTSKTTKIAEHGGGSPQDRHVPILIFGAGAAHRRADASVGTTQIAPTILRLLGLSPRSLDAVRLEHTNALPGF